MKKLLVAAAVVCACIVVAGCNFAKVIKAIVPDLKTPAGLQQAKSEVDAGAALFLTQLCPNAKAQSCIEVRRGVSSLDAAFNKAIAFEKTNPKADATSLIKGIEDAFSAAQKIAAKYHKTLPALPKF